MAETRPYSDVHGARSDGLIPLGGSGPVPILSAMDGVLSNTTAVRREVTNQSHDLRVLTERNALMAGSLSGIHRQAEEISKAVSDSLTRVAGTLVDEFGQAIDAAVKTAQAAQATVERHVVAADRRLDATNRPPGWVPNVPAAQQPLAVQQAAGIAPPAINPRLHDTPAWTGHSQIPGRINQKGGEIPVEDDGLLTNSPTWSRGRRVGIGQLRAGMRDSLSRMMSQYSTVPMGERLHPTDDGKGYLRADGTTATPSEISDFMAKDKSSAIVRNYGASIAEAKSIPGGIANMLPGGIGKALGWAGVAYTVGNQVLDQAANQRAANNQFVSVEGGGQAGAFREREQGSEFRLSQRLQQGFMGGLSGQDADQLFMGATQAGYRGDRRDEALAFGVQNFRKYGMAISDTLQLLTTAAQDGQTSLGDLSKSLDAVTKAAVQGGINAQQARQNFAAAYGAATQSFGGQGTAQVAAGAVTAAQAGLGSRYQGITTPGAFGDQMIQQIATETGKSFNEIAESQGAHGGVAYARYLQAHQMNAGIQLLGGDASRFQAAKQAVGRPAGEGGKYSEDQIAQMGQSFSNLDDRTLARVLQGPEFGMTGVTVANARGMLTNVLSGNNNIAAQAEKIAGRQARYKVGGVSAKDRATYRSIGMTESEIAAQGLSTAAHAAGSDAGLNSIRSHVSGLLSWLPGTGGKIAGEAEYQQIVEHGGRGIEKGYRSPMLEKFLKEGATDNTRVKVTGKGGDRVMTLKDALKYHPDEMERGNVEIVDGKQGWKGKTIADATGMGLDESVTVKTNKSKAGDHAGHNASYWERRWGNKDGGSNSGTVTISPSPELSRLLRFGTSGNVQYDGIAPPVADPGPAARPSGQTTP